MNEELMQQLIDKTEKGNKINTVHTVVLILCCALLAALIGVLFQFGRQVAQMGSGVKQMASVVSQLDVDELEDNLKGVQEQLGQLDMDALNETLQHASETTANMEKASKSFESFAQGMSNLFGGKK